MSKKRPSTTLSSPTEVLLSSLGFLPAQPIPSKSIGCSVYIIYSLEDGANTRPSC